MKRIGFLILLTVLSVMVFGQNERKYIRSGNKLFMEAVRDTTRLDTTKFSNAETEYRKALNKKPADLKWNFNLADALYKQKRFDEAAGKFKELGKKLQTPEEKARAFHNLGNSDLMQKKIDESIESYKEALRNNPNDLATKYNLAYAQMLKKRQQQQKKQNKNQNNKDKNNKDKDKNKNNQNNKNDQNKDKQNQQNQQNKQNQNQNKNQQQQAQNKISKENAEQLLQALQNDERKIQDKVKKEKAAKAKKVIVEKEW